MSRTASQSSFLRIWLSKLARIIIVYGPYLRNAGICSSRERSCRAILPCLQQSGSKMTKTFHAGTFTSDIGKYAVQGPMFNFHRRTFRRWN